MIGFDLLFFGNHNHLFSLWVFGSYHQIQVCVFGNLRSTISGYSRCGFCRRWLQSLAQSTTTMLSSSYLTLQNGSVLTEMWKSKVDLESRKCAQKVKIIQRAWSRNLVCLPDRLCALMLSGRTFVFLRGSLNIWHVLTFALVDAVKYVAHFTIRAIRFHYCHIFLQIISTY